MISGSLIKNKAFSLVEILIAMGMLAVITISIAFFAVDANRFSVVAIEVVVAINITAASCYCECTPIYAIITHNRYFAIYYA